MGLATMVKQLYVGRERVIVKAADETVNNSAALQADDDLLFSVGPNEKWQFEGVLIVEVTATADFKLRVTGPAGSAGSVAVQAGLETSTALTSGADRLGTDIVVQTAGAQDIVHFWGGIANGDTAGNLAFTWAQNAAEVSNAKVLAGSYMKYRKV